MEDIESLKNKIKELEEQNKKLKEEVQKIQNVTFFEVIEYDGDNYDTDHTHHFYEYNDHVSSFQINDIYKLKIHMLEKIKDMYEFLEEVCNENLTTYDGDQIYVMNKAEKRFYSKTTYDCYEKMPVENIINHAITISRIIYHHWPFGIKYVAEKNMKLETVKAYDPI